RMRQLGVDEPLEGRRQPGDVIGRQRQREQLDRHHPVVLRIDRAEHRTERPLPDFVKHSKGTESGRRWAGDVLLQWRTPRAEGEVMVARNVMQPRSAAERLSAVTSSE